MAIEIKMPQLSDTMSSGKIIAWRKKEGDMVERGDILAEVETDKANLEIESFNKGTLLKIIAIGGTKVDVGELIAIIGEPGEAANLSSITPQLTSSKSEPIQSRETSPTHIYQPPPAPMVGNLSSTPLPASNRVKASPLAKKLASNMNLDLSKVRGTGPQGRIVRRDIEGVSTTPRIESLGPSRATLTEMPRRSAEQKQSGSEGDTITPFSKMRETIARRMQESIAEIPHFYVSTTIDMENALKLREHLKEEADFKGITVNHLVIKATAYGLSKEPRVNQAVKNNQMFEPGQINIGIVTAVDDGLLIPVVKEADRLSLKDLIFEARSAVERARAGRPSSTDLVGGTFSISNLGMFDVDLFTAIINPGQGSILAVSSIKEVPVVKGGAIVPGKIMKVTLSVDHRIIDGVMAGTFLQHFKKALEMPALLLM